jgi:hypothetical protein
MNILKKLAYSILAAVFVFANANAGELSVTGAAKATYSVISVDGSPTDQNTGKGIGIANEFTLGASGELDNGWTWSMNQDIDGATVQDDKSIVIGMGGMGSFKINISDGGLQKNFASSQSVYGTPVDNGQVGTYTDAGDTGAMNSFRYTTPSGLPLDAVVAIQYAPYTGAADNNSSNAAGALDADGNESALEYAVDIVPIEGLKVGASYYDPDDSAVAQQEEGGAYYATYSVGAFSLGYGKSYQASSLDTDTTNGADYYDNTQMSVAFNVNDALSVSYEDVKSEKVFETTTSNVEMDVSSIQASYTVAGMTLSLSTEEYDNVDYTDGNKLKETNFAMSIAF